MQYPNQPERALNKNVANSVPSSFFGVQRITWPNLNKVAAVNDLATGAGAHNLRYCNAYFLFKFCEL